MTATETQTDPDLSSTRGVREADVTIAADTLLRDGLRPTIERIRQRLGRGSPNTINPLLDQWWKSLGRRLAGGPELAERIPPEGFRMLEALWVRLRIEAEQRAARALQPEHDEIGRLARQVELKSEVLTLREGEYREQLRRREKDLHELEGALAEKSAALHAAEAAATAVLRRAAALERELAEARSRIVELLARMVVRHRAARKASKSPARSTGSRPAPPSKGRRKSPRKTVRAARIGRQRR